MLSEHELAKGYNTLKIIWSALSFSLLFYVVVIPFLCKDMALTQAPAELITDLRHLLYGLAAITLAAAWLARRWLLAKRVAPSGNKSRQHPALQRYTTAMLVALAMTQSVGLYGLILFLMGQQLQDLVLLTVLAGVGMLFFLPNRDEVRQLVDRFDRGLGA